MPTLLELLWYTSPNNVLEINMSGHMVFTVGLVTNVATVECFEHELFVHLAIEFVSYK